jgi:hypothetical protein
MDHRRLKKVARDNGGFFFMALGAAWESVEVSHTLKYIRELAENLDWKGVAIHLWHPSPVGIFGIGCAWSIALHLWRRRKERINTAPPFIEKVQPEIAVAENTHLEPTNIAEIARALKPGESCEITEEVTRKRTIVVRAAQR